MKKGWERKRLGEIATIKPPKSEARERIAADALVSFLPMEDLGIAIKHPEPKQTKRLSDVVGSYTYFAEGDVLLAKITPCFENGKLGIANKLKNGIGFGSSEFIVIRPGSTVSSEWVFHFLSREDFRNDGAQRMGGAVGQQRVPREYVEGCEIPVPPLAEQQRIVGVLDEAFAGLATAQASAGQNLENARALFESHLQAVFTRRGEGWVEKRIEEWCESIMDCVNKTAPVVEDTTPFKMIRTTNVRNGRVDVSKVRFVTEETFRIWTRRQIPRKGDVILTREAPMGEVGMLLTDDKVFLGQRLVSYRANAAKLDNQFLLFALQSSGLQDQIREKASGSTVQHMRVPDTKNLLLAAPPLAKQSQIVGQLTYLLEESHRLAAVYEQKLAALAELKKSLLHDAFRGAL